VRSGAGIALAANTVAARLSARRNNLSIRGIGGLVVEMCCGNLSFARRDPRSLMTSAYGKTWQDRDALTLLELSAPVRRSPA